MKQIELDLLNNLRVRRGADLRKVSEQYRQKLIGWAMREPALVDVDADIVTVSAAGEALLREKGLTK